VIRPLRDADADDVAAYQGLRDVVAYLPWPVRDREASHAHTAARAARRTLDADGDAAALAITLPGEPGLADARADRVVGDLTLILTSAGHAQLAVGWVLHPGFQGRGFAREAATALLDLAFDLGAHRVAASVDPDNIPSLALCDRLGMRREALHRQDRHDGTSWRDTVVCATTVTEWRGHGPAR
jgi:RimJ/RimL family protein N-acetyltransferase